MNGAEALLRTLAAGGIDVCFANPGTSEIHLVAALDALPRIRPVLGLFEGVVTGAADGYARIAGKPAATLLHLGPGLANGLANLHNAWRARSPVVNLVGQHATAHLRYDTPLTADIEGLARPYSAWLRTAGQTGDAAGDAADAMLAASTAPGQIATLIVPADVAWNEDAQPANPRPVPRPPLPTPERIHEAARALASGEQTALLLAGSALYGQGLEEAGKIARATGAKLFSPYPLSRVERGGGRPPVERIHYVLEQAQEQLAAFRKILLVGATPPVAYFAYRGKSSVLTASGCEILTLATPQEDGARALELLARELPQAKIRGNESSGKRPDLPTGALTLSNIAQAVGALLPADAIVADESMTSGRGLMAATAHAPPHDWLGNTGGSIGLALPLALGAALASPERRVLCLTADGSGLYTAQSLWSMAREGSNITTVVFANRAYAVLKREFSYLGIGEPGPQAAALFDIGRPAVDWVALARGFGVPAARAASLDSFVEELQAGLAGEGPRLIEVVV